MLTDKLTKALRESEGWKDLVITLDAVNQKVIEPFLIRAKTLTSLFYMSEEDLNIRLDEMGSLMSFGQFDDVNKPLIIQQRTDEIHHKHTLYPLSKTLLREFGTRRVRWRRLYAPADFDTWPYGTIFVTKNNQQLYPSITSWIRVSRGVIETPISDFYKEAGGDINKAEKLIAQFKKSLDEVVEPLIPTHIVFDGQIFTIYISIRERTDVALFLRSGINHDLEQAIEVQDLITTSSTISNKYSIGNDSPELFYPCEYRMDCIDMDVCGLDTNWHNSVRARYALTDNSEFVSLAGSSIAGGFSRAIEIQDSITTTNAIRSLHAIKNDSPELIHLYEYRMDCFDLDICPLDADWI